MVFYCDIVASSVVLKHTLEGNRCSETLLCKIIIFNRYLVEPFPKYEWKFKWFRDTKVWNDSVNKQRRKKFQWKSSRLDNRINYFVQPQNVLVNLHKCCGVGITATHKSLILMCLVCLSTSRIFLCLWILKNIFYQWLVLGVKLAFSLNLVDHQ